MASTYPQEFPDEAVFRMVFKLHEGDAALVLCEHPDKDGRAIVYIHVPAALLDVAEREARSFWRGIVTEHSKIFAGRSVPMQTITAHMPPGQIEFAMSGLISLFGKLLQMGC